MMGERFRRQLIWVKMLWLLLLVRCHAMETSAPTKVSRSLALPTVPQPQTNNTDGAVVEEDQWTSGRIRRAQDVLPLSIDDVQVNVSACVRAMYDQDARLPPSDSHLSQTEFRDFVLFFSPYNNPRCPSFADFEQFIQGGTWWALFHELRCLCNTAENSVSLFGGSSSASSCCNTDFIPLPSGAGPIAENPYAQELCQTVAETLFEECTPKIKKTFTPTMYVSQSPSAAPSISMFPSSEPTMYESPENLSSPTYASLARDLPIGAIIASMLIAIVVCVTCLILIGIYSDGAEDRKRRQKKRQKKYEREIRRKLRRRKLANRKRIEDRERRRQNGEKIAWWEDLDRFYGYQPKGQNESTVDEDRSAYLDDEDDYYSTGEEDGLEVDVPYNSRNNRRRNNRRRNQRGDDHEYEDPNDYPVRFENDYNDAYDHANSRQIVVREVESDDDSIGSHDPVFDNQQPNIDEVSSPYSASEKRLTKVLDDMELDKLAQPSVESSRGELLPSSGNGSVDIKENQKKERRAPLPTHSFESTGMALFEDDDDERPALLPMPHHATSKIPTSFENKSGDEQSDASLSEHFEDEGWDFKT